MNQTVNYSKVIGKYLKVLFQFQKAFLLHIPQGTKDFFVKRFQMEEGSITDTEIGRRHHPKLFGRYRQSFWAKFTTKTGSGFNSI